MPDVPALQIYPLLWQQSLQQHPTDWRAQFRALCQLARDYRRRNRAAYFEDMITTMQQDFPNDANPLLRIDPSDPYVDKSQYPEIYPVQMNGKKYGHA